MLRMIISRKWILATVLVLAAMAVMARLGIWQLDRLKTRRAFNARVTAEMAAPVLDLRDGAPQADLIQMEYRTVTVSGVYDPQGEIALRNQVWNDQWGVHLITPLKIAGSDQAILVDRGWIPGVDYQAGNWSQYDESGKVTVRGVIRLSENKAELGRRSDPTPVPGAGPLKTWNFVNIPRLQEQISEPLLPVYIQQAPAQGWQGLPYRSQPELDLSEGPHLSYAVQWFMFATILGIGYPFYIRRQESRREKGQTLNQRDREVTQGSTKSI